MDLSEINDVISVRWFRQAFSLRYVLLIAVSLPSEMLAVGVGGEWSGCQINGTTALVRAL